MKHVKKDCWENDKGATLLERHNAGTFYIPNSFPTIERLAELREAIDDALRREKVLERLTVMPMTMPGQVEAALRETTVSRDVSRPDAITLTS